MARGWESKSVEAQQAEAADSGQRLKKRLSPEQQARHRQLEGLQLARKSIEQQILSATNPRHLRMLEESLAELDRQLGALNQPLAQP
jgi:hypothetical protein